MTPITRAHAQHTLCNRIRYVVITFVFACFLLPSANGLSAAENPEDNQRQKIETIIHDYLMANPEVLLRSIQVYREQQEQEEADRIRATLSSLGDTVANDPLTPVAGNPEGSVTVIEFFDYQCGYCKRALPDVQALLSTDDTIRLVYMEFPILGEPSVLASRASLAVWNTWPETYRAFHDALMGSRGSLNEDRILETAALLGLDTDRLKEAMTDPSIDQAIEQNYELAQSLGINGTPAFIFGSELVPGAIDMETMRQLVQQAGQG